MALLTVKLWRRGGQQSSRCGSITVVFSAFAVTARERHRVVVAMYMLCADVSFIMPASL